MDECVIAGTPTSAFVEKFKRAVELFKQYNLQDLNLTRQDMARKAVGEVGFLQLEPNQQMLTMKVLGHHYADNPFDQAQIIETAWNLYTNT